MATRHKKAPRPAVQRITEGTTVFDTAGEKIGTVSAHKEQEGYLVVQKGWLVPKDISVPVTASGRTDTMGIYLRVGKDDLEGQEWEAPPPPSTASPARQTRRQRTTGTGQEQATTQDVRVSVMEEELVAATRREERGRVHLHKEVVEERQTITMPVTQEEVRVERVRVQRQPVQPNAATFTAAEIDVPVLGEELVTGTRTVVVEEVRLHTDTVTEQQ